MSHLCHDRYRHLRRGYCTDRQSYGPMDACDVIVGKPLFLETCTASGMVAARAEGADVEAFGAQCRSQCRVVKLRVVGQGDERRTTVRLQPFERFIRPLG